MFEKMKTRITGLVSVKGVIAVAALTGIVFGAAMNVQPLSSPLPAPTATVPTLQYLTAADLNEIKAVLVAHREAIGDLRAGQKGLSIELGARIEKLEAAANPITTGSITKHGKR